MIEWHGDHLKTDPATWEKLKERLQATAGGPNLRPRMPWEAKPLLSLASMPVFTDQCPCDP